MILFWTGVWQAFLEVFIKFSMFVLNLIQPVLRLIFNIANINFFSEDIVGELATRVYIILGVLMLFKITISCIQYLINPDKSDDKENGFGGIAKRTIIAVALLAIVPSIFSFASEAQNAIVETLPKIILGAENSVNYDDIAKEVAYNTALGFFNYKEGCNNGTIAGLPGASGNPTFYDTDSISENSDVIVKDETCNGKNSYNFNYVLIIPASLFLIFVLISMALDVAIRSIKFGFLQLIAPIPIASYIDPSTSKKSFDSWVHNSLTVYADLFIRLGVIYLILYLSKIILSSFGGTYKLSNGSTITGVDAGLVTAAIVIGMFLFAKNAPKWICDVLGFKSAGDGMGDMFKRALGLAGAGFAGARTMRSNYNTQRERLAGKGQNWFQSRANALRSALAGGVSATGRGLKMATFDKKGFRDVRQNAFKNAIAARDARNDRVDNLYGDDYGYFEYRRDRNRSNLGIPSSPGFKKAVYDVMDTLAQNAGAEKSFGATKMNERPTDVKVRINGINYDIASARAFAEIQVGAQNITKPDGTVGTWTAFDAANARAIKEKVEKQTSYIFTAKLINEKDPTARMNHEKTILAIKNNESMFNVDGVMSKITEVFRDKGVISNTESMTYDKLLRFMENMPADPNDGAKIIDAVKTSFEQIRTDQYAAAQAADARAKKTQQAIQNDKKGS